MTVTTTLPSGGTDRRRGLRIAFDAPETRPSLDLGDGSHPVLDLSQEGLRVRHLDPVRPALGHRVQGMVHAPGGESAPVDGRVVWTSPTELGVVLDRSPLPLAFVMAVVAKERDRREAPGTH